MNDPTIEQLVAAGGFLSVECCGKVVGDTNPRPFTQEGAARFETIRQRHVSSTDPFGNAWVRDPEARELLADPSAHGPPDDGERLPFTCPTCSAAFVWAAGIPRRVAPETA